MVTACSRAGNGVLSCTLQRCAGIKNQICIGLQGYLVTIITKANKIGCLVNRQYTFICTVVIVTYFSKAGGDTICSKHHIASCSRTRSPA